MIVEGVAARFSAATATATATRSWVVALPQPLPDTRIVSPEEGKMTGANVTIELFSDTKGASFQCALDSDTFAPCARRASITLVPGSHRLEAAATADGETDPTPAVVHWTVRGSAPPPPPPPPPPPGLPETRLLSAPSGTVQGREARFRFGSDPPGARFDCALDDGPFASCSSPAGYISLDSGPHAFLVRARNTTGVDPTPAAASWSIASDRGGSAGSSSPSSACLGRASSLSVSAGDRCTTDGASGRGGHVPRRRKAAAPSARATAAGSSSS